MILMKNTTSPFSPPHEEGLGEVNSEHSDADSRHSDRSQEGVTIIVAIILLATISFISFSLSTLILRGIQFARVLQNSGLALSGAYSGGEISVFRFQRNSGGIAVTNSPLANGTLFDVYPNLTTLSYSAGASNPNPTVVNLYDADNIAATDAGYRAVSITNLGPNNVDIDVYSWSDSSTPVVGCSYSNIGNNTTRTCSVLGADRYQVVVRMQSASGGQTATVNVAGFADSSASVPKGVPSQTPTIEVVGKMSDVQRRIRVNL